MEAWRSQIQEAIREFPKPLGVKYSYGTAGFRMDASLLGSAVLRAGLLAALRSLATGQTTGLVITASHNQASDNGIKLVDPAGDMLALSWEPYAESIANAAGFEEILKIVDKVLETEHVHTNWKGKVLVARDTRPSGQLLVSAALKGIEALEATAVDMGVLTTPQLHWMVRATNKGSSEVSELAYLQSLSEAFRNLLEWNPRKHVIPTRSEVIVDGANGVGASKLADLQMLLESLKLEVRNSGEGELNKGVGADFVQKEKLLPIGFAGAASDSDKRCVSIDGDADRLVYFHTNAQGHLRLLDGDKILALFAAFLKKQLGFLVGEVSPSQSCFLPGYGTLSVGAVQTAYANGASTKYLKETLGLQVVITPTGVKYLHEQADKFDVGVYFEANGHGTILFREEFVLFLRREASSDRDDPGLRAINRLLAVSEMVNQAAGDAISGLLMVEVCLAYFGWSICDWDGIYSDLPSRQLKVKVRDRSLITTTCAETKVAKPPGLQEAIDKEIEKHDQGRAFARPSGTEDVVRVYAEAASQDSADKLAAAVAQAVQTFAGN